MSRILIIEDEEAIADLEKDYLELSGFEVEIENRGDTGLVRAMKEDFDLIILDLMLPEVDGFDICRQVREEKNTPIIMVSAKKDDIDKIRGLGLGADDYMTKPFMMSEFLARVRALTRRRSTIGPQVLTYGDLSLDSATYELICGEKRSRLTAKEYQIMELLMENAGRLISTEQIMDRIWGFESASEINVVWVNISYLRRKLKELGSRVVISSHRGIGYTLRDSEPEE